jgi:tRNA threonylcarbamoyladenosine modification (KEOPS) complex Cgi121 subunit
MINVKLLFGCIAKTKLLQPMIAKKNNHWLLNLRQNNSNWHCGFGAPVICHTVERNRRMAAAKVL